MDHDIIKKTLSGNCTIRSQRRLAPTSVAPVTTTITDSGHTHIKNTYESVNQTNSHATRFNMSCCTWLPSLSQIRARVHCANSGRETCGEVSPARPNPWRAGDLGATTAMPIALKLGGGLDVTIQNIPMTLLVRARDPRMRRNPRAVFSRLMTSHSSHSQRLFFSHTKLSLCHRDVKPENLLFDNTRSMRLKLVCRDFL